MGLTRRGSTRRGSLAWDDGQGWRLDQDGGAPYQVRAGCHFGEIPLISAHFLSFVRGIWRVMGVKWWRNGRVLGVILVDLAGL